MAVSRRDLKDEEIIRFLRFTMTESAAGVYTQITLDTNLSIETGLIWLIHWIEWEFGPNEIDEPAAGAIEWIQGQITRESKAAMLNLSDSDVIANYKKMIKRSAAIGTDAGPLWFYDPNIPFMQSFPIPLPFASQNIYCAIQSSSAAAKTIRGRIAYTIRRVSDKFFFRIAQAMIS